MAWEKRGGGSIIHKASNYAGRDYYRGKKFGFNANECRNTAIARFTFPVQVRPEDRKCLLATDSDYDHVATLTRKSPSLPCPSPRWYKS